MRIDHLALRAFGKFTDKNVDLSQGKHGLHIIYGDNEAGKSTSLRAILDWLFGFPHRTTDGFLHPNRNLRVGGVLRDSQNQTLGVMRRKANSNSLRDLEDREAISESALAAFLGNIDRDAFSKMFGIDQVRLREGGDALVQNRGQLGEALFAGASGINQLRSVNEAISNEMHRLFVSRGGGGDLGKKLESYKAKDLELKNTVVTASKWDGLQKSYNEALRRKDELVKLINEQSVQYNKLQRIQQNLQTVSNWMELSQQWVACKDYILLDDNFGAEIVELGRNQTAVTIELQCLQDEIATNEANLKLLPNSRGLERYSARLEELKLAEGTYKANRRKLPALLLEQAQICNELKRGFEEIGSSPELLDLQSIINACNRKHAISSLVLAKTDLDQKLAISKSQFEIKNSDWEATVAELEKLVVVPNLINLRAKLTQFRDENPAGQIEQLRTKISAEELELTRLCREVVPGGVSTAGLRNVEILSTFDIERFQEEERDLKNDRRQIDKEIEQEKIKLSDFNSTLEHMESVGTIPTVEALLKSREERDSAWELVKDRWMKQIPNLEKENSIISKLEEVSDIAQAFECLLNQADGISDELRVDATKVAQKFTLQRDIAATVARLKLLTDRLEDCKARESKMLTTWQAAWDSIGVPAKSPREMLEWVNSKEDLISREDSLEIFKKQLGDLEHRSEEIRSELESLLRTNQVGLHDGILGLSELLSVAHDFLEQQSRTEQTILTLKARRDSIEGMRRLASIEIQSDTEALKEWGKLWADEMMQLKLSPTCSSSEADRTLNTYGLLRNKLERQAIVNCDILGMEEENRDFLLQISRLYRDYGFEEVIEDDGTSPGDALKQMDVLTKDDRIAVNNRKSLEELLETKRANLAKKNHELTGINSKLNEYLKLTNKQSIAELGLAFEESCLRKRIQSELDKLRAILRGHAPGGDVEAFVAEVIEASQDIDGLQPQIDRYKAEERNLNSDLEQVQTALSEANFQINQLKKENSSTELSLEKELLASEIEEQVRELLVARLSSRVLREGIEKFREQNQAPILRSAAQYFCEMTDERFVDLRVDWEDDKPVIVAVPGEGGGNLKVEQMSDGTRDQLYLSLRLASIHEWLEKHPPLPFIVDDILIHFDDRRAKATLKSLASISNKTQVVFFTHHQHLVDLASDSLPSGQLFVHEL